MQLRNCIMMAAIVSLAACKNKTPDKIVNKNTLPVEKQVVPVSYPEENVSLFNHTHSETDVQKFVTRKKTVIVGRKGLKVTVDPGVLEKVDGSSVDGKITTRIIEITDSKGLFRNNAATVCDDRLLASGGSYFIEMTCGGQQLQVRKGKKLLIGIPRLSDDEMELFYGQRTSAGTMNWARAGNSLTPAKFSFNNINNGTVVSNRIRNPFEGKMFTSLKEHVYLYDKKITVGQLIDTLNKFGTKVKIDTMYMWPANLPKDQKLDTNFLVRNYGPMYIYKIVSYQEYLRAEAWQAARDARYRQLKNDSARLSLGDKLSKYYLQEGITQLGWINCDRFYDVPQTEVQLDLPIAFTNANVEYFLVFKSFMGMINDRTVYKDSTVLKKLPAGTKATIITFMRNNGQIYHGKQDFVVTPFAKVKVDPEPISNSELKKMFGVNISL